MYLCSRNSPPLQVSHRYLCFTGADCSLYGSYVVEHDKTQPDTVISKPGQIKLFSDQVIVCLRLFDNMGYLTISTKPLFCFISSRSGQMCVMNGTRNQNSFISLSQHHQRTEAVRKARWPRSEETWTETDLKSKLVCFFPQTRWLLHQSFPPVA